MTPATMYHIASITSVRSILERGLRTDADGWDTGYVWLFDDEDLALADLPRWHRSRGGATLLAVDVTGLDVIPDPHPGWGDHRDAHSFAVAHHIDPHRVVATEPSNHLPSC